MPPPAPQPKPQGKKIGGLPWWAWAAAAAVGLIVGYVLTRSKPDDPAGTAGTEDQSRPTTGAGGGAPALPDLLEALGLRPGSADDPQGGGKGIGSRELDGGGGGGGSSSTVSVTSTDSDYQVSLVQQARGVFTSPAPVYYGTPYSAPTPVYHGATAASTVPQPTPSSPYYGLYSAPSARYN